MMKGQLMQPQCLLTVRLYRGVGLMPFFLGSTVGIWHLGWAKNGDIAFMKHASGIVCILLIMNYLESW